MSEEGRERERERGREGHKQLHTDTGLNLTNLEIMT